MNKSELKDTLADAINQGSLKEIIETLIDITTTAAENNPGWEWETDRALLLSVRDLIKN
jgi:hypothetical protein